METGKNIQRIAKILYWLILGIGLLAGIVAFVLLGKFLSGTAWILLGFCALLLCVALSFPIAWIVECLFSGFGEMVENTAVIRDTVAPDYVPFAEQRRKEAQPRPAPDPQRRPEPKPAPAEPPKPAPAQNVAVRCPNCGAEQAEGRKSCWNCGAKLPEA